MQYINRIEDFQGEHRTAITLGKFDGLHRGHQKLIEAVIKLSKEAHNKSEELESMVFAFDMLQFRKEHHHPYEQIMLREEKIEYLNCDIDYLLECPFDEEIRSVLAEDFIEQVLVKQFRAKYIVVGHGFRFGYKAQGDVALLKKYETKYDYKVLELSQAMYGERVISSTFIKERILNRDIVCANQLLGYCYTIHGTVIHGLKLGRKLGFPTMNIVPSENKLLPPFGVYVVQVIIGNEMYYGIANLGSKPTVIEQGKVLVEVHVFDYEGDTYGEKIQVQFLKHIRDEQKFSGVDALKMQMQKDIEVAKNLVYKKQVV